MHGNKKEVYFGKKKKIKEVNYYRDIPCEGNIYRAFFIGYDYGIISKRTYILGAILLKWIKDKKVQVEKRQGKYGKEETIIKLSDETPKDLENSKEMQLYDMLYEASEDGVLETKEFQFWCADNYTTINSWFEHIITSQRNLLIKEGKIEVKKGMKKYIATDELKQEAEELLGLKRFLLEYTLIGQREAIEVVLFEKYLIYAQMMGIAKKVAKEFKEIYPEVIEQSSFGTYEDLIFITAYTSNYASAVDTAVARANSYYSGGGGFSSGGRRRRLFRWRRWRRPEVSAKRKECDLT